MIQLTGSVHCLSFQSIVDFGVYVYYTCTNQYFALLQVLAIEPKNLEATKLKILQLVCRGSRYEDAAVALRRFFAELERAEPKV